MIVINTIEQLREQTKQWRSDDNNIAFVPTMGNLHSGHLSLVELAQKKASRVVVSIYVNPMQFSADEDFESYPRTVDSDLEKLSALNVDCVFMPNSQMIYPNGENHSSFIHVPTFSEVVEGEFRPWFMKGVATVVLKLLNMVQPDIAIFGEKDYQQLLMIKQMVKDLNLPIDIIGGETKRELDGLAMSSRNEYLSESERELSATLAKALQQFRSNVEAGIKVSEAEESCKSVLVSHDFLVDYITLRDAMNLDEIHDQGAYIDKNVVILAAAKIGRTRLIDNLQFTLS